MSATDFILPRCPLCSNAMALHEAYPSGAGVFTCFFRCVVCFVQYPRQIAADLMDLVRAQSRADEGIG